VSASQAESCGFDPRRPLHPDRCPATHLESLFDMSTLEKAISIAAQAHAGQVDKAGQPYILHPIRVMLRMESEVERVVAVLHDVIEDSDLTLDYLRAQGFSDEIVAAVEALTKREGETRLDAAKRAAENGIAIRVKLADNAENSDMSRIDNPSESDLLRLKEYEAVREFLISKSGK
jgi:GTP diphosphokinase / guanosine-3',5'-bis(diphosphate) 3'-diphosphatase